jgi:hypothetical protein
MEKELTGDERRKILLSILRESKEPLSGSILGQKTNVSRQVVVQDMALLRTQGYSIKSTTKGYYLDEPANTQKIRTVKVCHTDGQVEDELNAIVDLGGTVLDVMVNHRAYGKMSAAINIKSRRDVQAFVDNIKSGKSSPLLNVTSGYHFHRISADSEAILDEIEEMLKEKGYLAQVLPYEEKLWD